MPEKILKEAEQSKESTVVITCPYCTAPNVFNQSRRSPYVDQGFDYLCHAKFSDAHHAFSSSLHEADLGHRQVVSEAYLGLALAAHEIQIELFDTDTEMRMNLICHNYKDTSFGESDNFDLALATIDKELRGKEREDKKKRFRVYADIVDGIMEEYRAIEARNAQKGKDFKYGAFIAYTYDSTRVAPINNAHFVKDELKDSCRGREIFMPYDIDVEYSFNIKEEAKILYAIDHTNSMVVVTDGHFESTAMQDVYNRFYRHHNNSQDKLAFLRFGGQFSIAALPGGRRVERIFDSGNLSECKQFVSLCNGVINAYCNHEFKDGVCTKCGYECEHDFVDNVCVKCGFARDEIRICEHEYNEEGICVKCGARKTVDAPKFIEPNHYEFGSYPQSRVTDERILDVFRGMTMPSRHDNAGWTPLYCSKKTGNPCAWYKDEQVDGRLYRGVYFTQQRAVYSYQESNVLPSLQMDHSYPSKTVHCFAFEPILWTVKHKTLGAAEIVSARGLDSKEFNCTGLENCYCRSTLHEWLNSDFLKTAFTEDQLSCFGMLGYENEEDRVYLMRSDYDRHFYESDAQTVIGTDYYRCLGGMGDYAISCFWLEDDNYCDCERASVIYAGTKNTVSAQYVDCTSVAVVPKIVIKI